MAIRTCILAALCLAAAARRQETMSAAEAIRQRKARINELRKDLSSPREETRLSAIRQLGEIHDSDARSLLIEKMTTDTEEVRQAAAKAIILHRKPICAQALGNAIQANIGNEKLVKFFITMLAELDMCASIPILVATLQTKASLGGDVLKAIVAIGCPEAAGPLVNLLKKAETEERKPDFFDDGGLGGFSMRGGRAGGAGGGQVENKTKDKAWAALAPKIRKTLATLTGLEFDNHRDWSAAVSSGAAAAKVVSVYLCEESGKTYEMQPGKSNKCPYSTKSGHDDTFLKHHK